MLAARPVTFLTRDAQYQAGFVESICWRRLPLEEAAMTFQASRNDRLIETGRAIRISGTVNPTVQFCPVTHGQLKQRVAFPEQISLPFPTGTNHHIDAFSV